MDLLVKYALNNDILFNIVNDLENNKDDIMLSKFKTTILTQIYNILLMYNYFSYYDDQNITKQLSNKATKRFIFSKNTGGFSSDDEEEDVILITKHDKKIMYKLYQTFDFIYDNDLLKDIIKDYNYFEKHILSLIQNFKYIINEADNIDIIIEEIINEMKEISMKNKRLHVKYYEIIESDNEEISFDSLEKIKYIRKPNNKKLLTNRLVLLTCLYNLIYSSKEEDNILKNKSILISNICKNLTLNNYTSVGLCSFISLYYICNFLKMKNYNIGNKYEDILKLIENI